MFFFVMGSIKMLFLLLLILFINRIQFRQTIAQMPRTAQALNNNDSELSLFKHPSLMHQMDRIKHSFHHGFLIYDDHRVWYDNNFELQFYFLSFKFPRILETLNSLNQSNILISFNSSHSLKLFSISRLIHQIRLIPGV